MDTDRTRLPHKKRNKRKAVAPRHRLNKPHPWAAVTINRPKATIWKTCPGERSRARSHRYPKKDENKRNFGLNSTEKR